jgi:hypothetical protein
MTETCRAAHVEKIRGNMKSLREWLDWLERDLQHEQGAISAVVLTSISEASMYLIYNAGIVNGTALCVYDTELEMEGKENEMRDLQERLRRRRLNEH